jgi:hypothetical protein
VIGEGASAVAARDTAHDGAHDGANDGAHDGASWLSGRRAERLAILAHLERDTTRLLPADAALARRMASRNAAGTGAAASAAFASALVSAAGVAEAGAAAPIGAARNDFREGAPTTAPSGAAGNGFRDFREGARLTGSAIYEATHGLTKPAAGWTNPPAGLGAGLSGQVLELRCPDCMLIAIDCR